MSERNTDMYGMPADDVVEATTTEWIETPPTGQTGRRQSQKNSGSSTKQKASNAVDTAEQKASKVADKASQTADQVIDQATSATDTGMDKAAGGMDKLAGEIRHQGQSMGSGTMQSAATSVADALESGAQFLRDKDTDELMTDLEGVIRRKPVESMLVAAGVGFFLAKAIR
jgi:cell division septum initiation protein DivIVA